MQKLCLCKRIQAAIFGFLLLSCSASTVLDAQDSTSNKVRAIVAELNKAEERVNGAQAGYPVIAKIELVSWQLMLGEYTSSFDDLSLSTTSINAFLHGRKLLDEIEENIKRDPELEQTVSTDPLMALRLDTARARLGLFEEKLDDSRKKEIQRLSVLRSLNRDYRQLNQDLTEWLASQTIGDPEKSSDAAKKCLANLQQIFVYVGTENDLHLFDDEPQILGKEQFQISGGAQSPFSDNPISLLKALQGLIHFELFSGGANPQFEQLAEAKLWANAALDAQTEIPGTPAGVDSKNLLANYVLALCKDAEASNLALDADPDNRAKARLLFEEARNGLVSFQELLAEKGYSEGSTFGTVVSEKLLQLQSPDSMVRASESSFFAGRTDIARQQLLEAIKRHGDAGLALSYVMLGLRSEVALADLENEVKQFSEIGLIDLTTPQSALLSTRLANVLAGKVLTHEIPANSDAIAKLVKTRQQLKQWIDDGSIDSTLQAQIRANYALTFVYAWALGNPNGDGTDLTKTDIEQIYRLARDAEYHFANKLKETSEEHPTWEHYALQEDLVYSRLSLGHLAALSLDDWRDESQIFFAAAASEASRLKMSSYVLSLIGSPLLRHVLEKDDGGGLKLANQERQKRQMMTLSLEAMYASLFGEKEEAAAQMSKAVAAGLAGQQLNSGDIDLDELSQAADGLDSGASLVDTVQAFRILSEIDAGHVDEAFQHAAELTSHGEQGFELSREQLENRLNNIQSPLVGYAFSKSVESLAVNIPLKERLDDRKLLLEYSRKGFERVNELLDSERLSLKYPQLVSSVKTELYNLESPEYFESSTKLAKSNGNTAQALSSVSDGLARHPENKVLWQTYFELQIQSARTSPENSPNLMSEVLLELEAVKNLGMVSEFEYQLNSGTIFELLGQFDKALASFEAAIGSTNDQLETIKAVSGKTRIRNQQIKSSNALTNVTLNDRINTESTKY